MATNRRYAKGSPLSFVVPSPTKSGDPVVIGTIPGVALTSYDANQGGKASLALDGVFDLPVKGINAGGNVAVAVGDALYFTSGDTPPISKKATGVFFGHALEAITPGATDTIYVRVQPSAP